MSSGGGSGSESFLGGSYSESEWQNVLEVAERLGIREQVKRETPAENRDLLLDKLGYAAGWSIENGFMGLLAVWFTTCRRCGAVVPLREAEQGHLAPLDQHTHWHYQVEGVTPSGRGAGSGAGGR